VTGMAMAHCILGRFLGLVCHCFPPECILAYYKSGVLKTLVTCLHGN